MNSKAPSGSTASAAHPPATAAPVPAPVSATPPFPLLDYLDDLMGELYAQIPPALRAWDEHAIHKSRVATRRLKAALDLMEPVLTRRQRRPLARALRRLRRRLGPLRDADVMLGHLVDLAVRPGRAEAAAWLTAHLREEREALRRASMRRGPPSEALSSLEAWERVRRRINESQDAVDALLAQSLHAQVGAFAEQADRLAAALTGRRERQRARGAKAQAARLLPADGQEPARDGESCDPPAGDVVATGTAGTHATQAQDPHELRISGKALRYTLEMAQAAGHRMPRSVLKTFKRMQEDLGGWHDFIVLAERAMRASLSATLGQHDAVLPEQALDLARLATRKGTQYLDRFAKLWRGRGAQVSAAIRHSFPLAPPTPEPTASAAAPRTEAKTVPHSIDCPAPV